MVANDEQSKPGVENDEPAYPLLSSQHPDALLEALVSIDVCQPIETIVSVDKAGEGNMNLTLRVTTDQRSVIVKQARPWVEKYPDIAASDERILAEINFYLNVSKFADVYAAMPSVLATDPQQRLLVLEDLGLASDYASFYDRSAEQSEVDRVFDLAMDWISQLHDCEVASDQPIGCKPLRTLNHQHIFTIPLADPPVIDLNEICDGLTTVSQKLLADDSVQQAMAKVGEVYLSDDGGVLLHGDYYPGSWLKTDAGFRVIDPEFCFVGPPEFDLGVLAAHWIFCGGQANRVAVDRVVNASGRQVSEGLVFGFAGAELIRRLLGVAQLPLNADLQRRTQWLECGIQFLQESL